MSHELLVPALLVALTATYRDALDDPREYILEPARSQLWVVTHRSGLLSFFGHKHAIVPTEWSGVLCLDDPPERGAAGTIVIRTGSLVIDSDAARALAGLGRGPDEDAVREIQQKLLDAEHLDAERHAEIRLDVLSVQPGGGGDVDAQVRLELRGVAKEFRLPVRVRQLDGLALELSGELRVRQRDFGMEPESVARVVNVANEVDLHFRIVAVPTTRPCAIGG